MRHLRTSVLLLLALLLSLCGCGGGGAGGGAAPGGLPAADRGTVYYMDVGQGDSTVIVSQTNEACIIDAGRNSAKGQLVADYARSQGVTEFKYAFSTHPDTDHFRGFRQVLPDKGVIESIPVGKFVCSGASPSGLGTEWNSLMSELSAKSIPIENATAGASYPLGNITIQVLAPPSAFVKLPTSSFTNENSMVLRMANSSGFSCFFGGDVENEGVPSLLAAGYNLHSSIMLVPHHGSKNGLTQPLYDAISPQTAVISVGTNTFGHPTAEVLAIVNGGGAALYRTDLNGNVTVRFTGATYTIETQK